MLICISGDDLRVNTSSTPSRDMVRELIALRSEDRFIFTLSEQSLREAWCGEYFGSLPKGRWTIHPERHSRRLVTLAKLLGVPGFGATKAEGDVYIRFNMDTFGPGRKPLIALIADLSAIRRPKEASLRWHGRILFRRGIRDALKIADRITAISEFSRNDLIDYAPESAPLLRVIPNGLGAAWFSETRRSGVSTIPPDGPGYFIWYGQVTPRKNIGGLIEAYGRLARQYGAGDIPELLIVGRFLEGEGKIRAAVAAHGLESKVRLLPPQPLDALVQLVADSRGLVFPSFYEGFGMPVVEAMACGRPVLTSSCSSMPEVAGGHAVLCDPADPDSIAAGMARLLDGEQWRPEAMAARRSWARNFTARAAAEGYSALIDEVIAESHRS
ncbi:mannosyl-N-acetyl-alpha-D-glucosaminyl-diphospho-ditrans,octacis-undecaprenol 3-alpha-mannosyltransferase / alpha-1,3-rhamnosyltransferase [Methylococcus capsulatus]|uniref:Mannosyl-N-acetyl-alpha-D-glucosaminyl-diphospho-ditrans,octacis-undecaprenol 3-alpha-mannosyltransferase / alpha-1,3-rhamnosyltransferase n=1 Tax=Methylococcus capsulatus TaxID=414 RepID=A0AA35V283_METCP|nr:glycosyltransferase family 1 protein [Methylococcus capsulatus]CAI8723293.1 mannosyl-N-acetyl-alpha-D-glucosaminyl-diphospho-ditrans,octacis-undecaprenol 3-alpha-mannosyltransferase / alpha-1,3-rhamnosyltransferase [Methylococcus capsulatus]